MALYYHPLHSFIFDSITKEVSYVKTEKTRRREYKPYNGVPSWDHFKRTKETIETEKVSSGLALLYTRPQKIDGKQKDAILAEWKAWLSDYEVFLGNWDDRECE